MNWLNLTLIVTFNISFFVGGWVVGWFTCKHANRIDT